MARNSSAPTDPATRDEQIFGRPVRIPPLKPEEFTPEAMEITQNLRKAAGAPPISHVPDYIATVLRHPALARPNMEMGMQMLGAATISLREREFVVLRNAWLMGAPFEWGEHVKIGRRVGMTHEEVERIKVGSSAPGWTDHERALLRIVEEMFADISVTDETWAALARTYSDKQMIELVMVIGQYTATAYVQNALRARPDPGNNGLKTEWKDVPPPAAK